MCIGVSTWIVTADITWWNTSPGRLLQPATQLWTYKRRTNNIHNRST